MAMQSTNNVVVVGAGPVGITTACVLKAVNRGLNITVIDKRSDPKRNHGLSIQHDSIAKINEVLEEALTNHVNSDQIKSLQNILKNWSGHFVRTNDIEITLAKQAKSMGIEVLRDPAYEISKGDLDTLLDPNTSNLLTDNKKKLKALLTAASVIIAADGSHSLIREDLGIKLADENTLKYMAELKYQTEGQTQPRGYKEATLLSSKTGYVAIEAINRGQTNEKKPATFLVFLDAETHSALQAPDETGKLKGFYGNPWTLKELKERSLQDIRIYNLYKTIDLYLDKVKSRGGSSTDEKIVGLELKIYRASESVKKLHGKHVLLVGDANSGLILQRGFNKGLKEVALCAHAVNKFFQDQPLKIVEDPPKETLSKFVSYYSTYSVGPMDEAVMKPEREIPNEFVAYEKATQELFNQEKAGIYRKDKGIKVAQLVVGSTASSLQMAEEMSHVSSMASKNALEDMRMASDYTVRDSVNSFSFFSSVINWFFSGSKLE
jgi:2-polyprenyl-6-methoxyphenol hydroxylase-like FAD-dependent oxidoreductase